MLITPFNVSTSKTVRDPPSRVGGIGSPVVLFSDTMYYILDKQKEK